jgi:hypothetical protein
VKPLLFLATSAADIANRRHMLATAIAAQASGALVRFHWEDAAPKKRTWCKSSLYPIKKVRHLVTASAIWRHRCLEVGQRSCARELSWVGAAEH